MPCRMQGPQCSGARVSGKNSGRCRGSMCHAQEARNHRAGISTCGHFDASSSAAVVIQQAQEISDLRRRLGE
eukprot:4989968-Pyramimonas_sp.AAC.1